MYQNVKRKCKAIDFANQTYCFVAFSSPLPSSPVKEFKRSYSNFIMWTFTPDSYGIDRILKLSCHFIY